MPAPWTTGKIGGAAVAGNFRAVVAGNFRDRRRSTAISDPKPRARWISGRCFFQENVPVPVNVKNVDF